ncbi:MAG: transposase [Spirochaetales bacterium]|nr:transposase [Spirochaetales bacterium]
MRTLRVSMEDQYRLIMECRRSGLSDQQWCMNHDIKPGTFYNWVKRLRQRGCQDIPAATGRATGKSIQQEVVRIERNQATAMQLAEPSLGTLCASMELSIGNLKLKIPNGTDPMLLSQTIRVLSELAC